MPEALRQRLRQRLIARYAQLRHRLERMVGSREDATEALQETWVQLEGVSEGISVKNDDAYLLGMATKIAGRVWNEHNALLTATELHLLEDVADETYDTARLALARVELEELIAMLQHMPMRQRTILISARVHGLSYEQIARQSGLSVSLVHKEMHRALKTLRRYQATQEAAYADTLPNSAAED